MPYLNLKGRRVGFSKNTPQKIPFMQKWNFKEMGCGLHHGMLAQREQICFFVVYIWRWINVIILTLFLVVVFILFVFLQRVRILSIVHSPKLLVCKRLGLTS